jgi:hypothetical protein
MSTKNVAPVGGATLTANEVAKGPASAPDKTDSPPQRWIEAQLVFPIYVAMAEQFHMSPAPCRLDDISGPERPESLLKTVRAWFDELDEQTAVNQVRQLLQAHYAGAEKNLRAFALRLLRKASKMAGDRHKVDFVMVQYFAASAPQHVATRDVSFADTALVLRPILGQVSPYVPEALKPLEAILEGARNCTSLAELLHSKLLEQGRQIKDGLGDGFYQPETLVAFCRFNYLLRRSFIRLSHADLRATRDALCQLESCGVSKVDGSSAGLSASEPVAEMHRICSDWKHPFRAEFTEYSIPTMLERLIALRGATETALATVAARPAAQAVAEQSVQPAVQAPVQAAVQPAVQQSTPKGVVRPAGGPLVPPEPAKAEETNSEAEHASEQLKLTDRLKELDVEPKLDAEPELDLSVDFNSGPRAARVKPDQRHAAPKRPAFRSVLAMAEPTAKTAARPMGAAAETPKPPAQKTFRVADAGEDPSKVPGAGPGTIVNAQEPGTEAAAQKPTAKSAPAGITEISEAEIEACSEKVWEQLIAAPRDRGRSMSSINIEGVKLMLSSWEVISFVSDNGPIAKDIRRAVVVRALLALALETHVTKGDRGRLAAALTLAANEMNRLQGAVEKAKSNKQTEGAVNMAMTAKRLLAFVEQAGDLRV